MNKKEVGGKAPLGKGEYPDKGAQAKKSAKIRYETAEFLVNGGKVEHVEFGTMKTDTKGPQPIRIGNG